MTVIRPNSVSGINSITAQANEIKVFKSDGTQGGLIIGGANLNATSGISTVAALTVTGNVSVGGTLTYQDVTNIDSVGIITARAGVKVPDSQKIFVGTDNDLQIFHDGNHSYVKDGGNGSLILLGDDVLIKNTAETENKARFHSNGNVELYYDNSKKFETTSGGVEVSSGNLTMQSNGRIFVGNGGNAVNPMFANVSDTNTGIAFPAADTMMFTTGGSERLRITSTGIVQLATDAVDFANGTGYITAKGSGDLVFRTTNSYTERLRITSNGMVRVNDSASLTFGNNDDMRIFHDGGSANYIDVYNKDLYIRCNRDSGITGGDIVLQPQSGENSAIFRDNGAVELYYNNTKKFETTSGGVDVSGSSDGVLNLDTTDGRGSFIRFKENGTTKAWVGCAEGMGGGTSSPNQDDLGLRASRYILCSAGGAERLRIQNTATAVHVKGESALTGTTGDAKGLSLAVNGSASCPLYFGAETHSAQKSIYLNGYWMYIRGHSNEGIRFVFSQGSGNAPRSDQYQFKYNQATRPTGNTTWDGFSDRRAKENVQDVTSALDTIGRLRPVTFDWTNDYADRMNMFNMDKTDPKSYNWFSVKENGYDESRKNNNVGFIAQEFEEVFPKDITETEMELGGETITDFKTVNFDSLVPMLTKAVQELKAENDSLKARLDAAGL